MSYTRTSVYLQRLKSFVLKKMSLGSTVPFLKVTVSTHLMSGDGQASLVSIIVNMGSCHLPPLMKIQAWIVEENLKE
jgi:hypothetical protein